MNICINRTNITNGCVESITECFHDSSITSYKVSKNSLSFKIKQANPSKAQKSNKNFLFFLPKWETPYNFIEFKICCINKIRQIEYDSCEWDWFNAISIEQNIIIFYGILRKYEMEMSNDTKIKIKSTDKLVWNNDISIGKPALSKEKLLEQLEDKMIHFQ